MFGVIQRAEALYAHTQAGLFPARREEYGADVRSRLELAATEQATDHLAASRARERLRAGFARLFREADLLLTPVAGGSPVPIGEERLTHLGRELEFRQLVLPYTIPQNLAGLPACAVRAGFDELGIPIGVQLTGPPWSEARVLGAARAFHAATEELQARWPDLPVE
jgi:aspartyl-tRNA(Asn)/glutamyl-tRNA(Gln) amidotransferase subunit A